MPPTHLFPPLSRRLSTYPRTPPLTSSVRPTAPPLTSPHRATTDSATPRRPQASAALSPSLFQSVGAAAARPTRSTSRRRTRRPQQRRRGPQGAQARGGGVRSSRSSSPSRHRLSLPSPVIAGSGRSRLLLPTVLPPTPPQHAAEGERGNYHCESRTTSARLRHIITQREAPSCGLTKSSQRSTSQGEEEAKRSQGARPSQRRRGSTLAAGEHLQLEKVRHLNGVARDRPLAPYPHHINRHPVEG